MRHPIECWDYGTLWAIHPVSDPASASPGDAPLDMPVPTLPKPRARSRAASPRAASRRVASDHALIQAKLHWLNPGPQVLERPRLLQALAEHSENPLTLVVAEAGYGKTSLCAAYARQAARPVIWYSLMPSDADLATFGRYLLAGFRRGRPRFGRAFERALEETRPGGRSSEILAGTFIHALAELRGPRMLLILDDFHEVAGDAAVVSFVDSLIRNLPENLRVLIASRTSPPLRAERMRVRGELFELHSGHLRLTREELSRLFKEVYERPLNEEELTALEETTLGWPTAVHLVHETLRRSDRGQLTEVLQSFLESHLELHDYLSAEVYHRLDDLSRHLLERTAALAHFDAALAGELTGRGMPTATLDALTRRGLLRSFGSGEHLSYACHDLVRGFVRQQLITREGSQSWRELEADTAEALLARGETETALPHLLAAGRAVRASQVLKPIIPTLLQHGRAAMLRGYLLDLPETTVSGDLVLALALADAHQTLGSWDDAESHYVSLLERCRALLGTVSPDGEASPREIECWALIGLGKVYNLRGRNEQVLGMVERGLALTQPTDIELRARLMQLKAGSHFYLGQYRAAMQVLDQVRAMLPRTVNSDLLLPTLHNLAIAYAAQGRYREALEEFRVALAQVRRTDSPRAPLYLSNLAFLHFDLGELAEGRRAAEEGLLASQRFSNRAQECMCHEALAQILAEAGDLDGALASLKRAEELDAELRIEVIAADLLALRGRIFCARGEYRRAVEYMTRAIERCGERTEAPRRIDFQTSLAWCELRAGRVRVARDLLVPITNQTDAGENDAQRMRAHYWLAEALLALGEKRGVDGHLAIALRLVRERGYQHFLRVQAGEEPAPLVRALAQGIEPDVAAAGLIEAGAAVEPALLAMLERAPTAIGETALSVLAEVGTSAARVALEHLTPGTRALQPAIRTTIRRIAERVERGRGGRASADTVARRLVLFGPPRIDVDGQPLPASAWRAQRAFHVLIFLALHPRGASREELLERFWPGRQLAAGKKNFHPTLSYVRRVLPDSPSAPILRDGEVYRLNPQYPIACDAWEFDRALEESRSTQDPASRREALEHAVKLASGPFLSGIYSDWADTLQARTRDRLEKALLELAASLANEGAFESAHDAFRRAVELDEYREESRLALIECQMRLGQRRAALAEYEKLKTVLHRELAVDPLPETDERMQRLLRGEGVHGWPGSPGLPSSQTTEPQEVEAPTQVPVKGRSIGSRT